MHRLRSPINLALIKDIDHAYLQERFRPDLLRGSWAWISTRTPFNPMDLLSDELHCIAMDIRNANGSASTGPLEIDNPWDSHADDQLSLMDHLGIERFMVLGFCIGGPFIWNFAETRT